MPVYIRSAACLSPQNTFLKSGAPLTPMVYQTNRLSVIEPDYKAYIDAKLIRRMSRIIRMGVAAAMQCLQDAGIDMPDAIITGTAYGCLEDTGTFLTRIAEQHEEMLSPTAFIQSTHNTIGAQIALMLRCHHYNNTFTQSGHSFESALLDAMLLLQEGEITNALTGSADELTDISFDILSRFNLFRKDEAGSSSLIDLPGRGTIAGEGAAFFLLSNENAQGSLAQLEAMEMFYNPADDAEIQQRIEAFTALHNISPDTVDLVITGRNGDNRNDAVYNRLSQHVFTACPLLNYKQLCGEYPTSVSFALWLAVNIIQTGVVPESGRTDTRFAQPVKRVLIYNHYQHQYHTLMLVAAC